MAVLYTFKIRGLTSGSSTIATTDVTVDSDDMLRFTDSTGQKRVVPIQGDFAILLQGIFTGGSGYDAGSSNVQGHRTFGNPSPLQ